jgi:bifunctional non-homologous end joining protein LigD
VRVAGAAKPYIVIDDVAGLAGLAQFAAVELHPWGARADDVERPDMITIDLDPDEGLPFARLLRATLAVRERLESLGLATFPKLTGGKGLHVVVPLTPSARWPEVKAFARTLVEAMAEAEPERYTTSARKAGRKGRIFLDYLRNDRAATAIAAWSPRARRGAPISVPVSWRWLERRRERPVFSLADLPAARRIADPWDGFERARVALRAAAGKS